MFKSGCFPHHRPASPAAGIGDQDIDAAPSLHDTGDGNRCVIGHIDFDSESRPAYRLDLGGVGDHVAGFGLKFLVGMQVEVADRDLGPKTCESLRVGPAKTTRRTGDERDLAMLPVGSLDRIKRIFRRSSFYKFSIYREIMLKIANRFDFYRSVIIKRDCAVFKTDPEPCRGNLAAATLGRQDSHHANAVRLPPTATTDRKQAIWHVEDALCATIGDRRIEEPELISFPSEPTRPEIAALTVIVARCGVAKENLCRLTIDNI